MSYPGGKLRLHPNIINLMPPHRVYIETHLGGGAVMRKKRPAALNIGIDLDATVAGQQTDWPQTFQFLAQRAEDFLSTYPFQGDELIYCDPPYYPPTRRRSRVYKKDYTQEEHVGLLKILRQTPCRILISGYPHEDYDLMLPSWKKHLFAGTSQSGKRIESVWANFDSSELHDDRFIGVNFRQRQTVKRRVARWKSKFLKEPLPIRTLVLKELTNIHR